jgi:hypothetical protein
MRLLFLLPLLLFLGCDNSEKSKTKEENLSREELYPDINFSDCYSLNEDQCQISNECKIWKTRSDDEPYHHLVYIKDKFCIDDNATPIFISCIKFSDTSTIHIKPDSIYNLEIYEKNETSIIIYQTGWIGTENKTDWKLNKSAWNELFNNLQENQLYFPKFCDEL